MMYLFMHILKTRAPTDLLHRGLVIWRCDWGYWKYCSRYPLHISYIGYTLRDWWRRQPQRNHKQKKCDVFAQWTNHEVCGGGKIPKPKSEWCIYCANIIHRCGFVFYPTLYYTMWRYWHFWKPYDFWHEQMISKNASASSLVVMVTPKLLLVAP